MNSEQECVRLINLLKKLKMEPKLPTNFCGTKLDFDPTLYFKTAELQPISEYDSLKRSECWKYFGFIKIGDEYPKGTRFMFCSVCWNKGVAIG